MADGKLRIHMLSPKRTIYEGEASRIVLPGDQGVFEILPHHVPVISMLSEGDIVLDGTDRFTVEKGLVKCLDDNVVILIEETSLQSQDAAE